MRSIVAYNNSTQWFGELLRDQPAALSVDLSMQTASAATVSRSTHGARARPHLAMAGRSAARRRRARPVQGIVVTRDDPWAVYASYHGIASICWPC